MSDMSDMSDMRFVDDVLRGKIALPTIPRVVRRAAQLLRNPDLLVRDLAAELAQDPVITARVLRLANSPFYGARRPVASVDDAVSAVGMQALGTMLMAAGVTQSLGVVKGVDLQAFWRHAGVTAAAARSLARERGADGEAAFLAGLLHESGHLILCQAFAAQAAAAYGSQPADAPPLHGQALADAEAGVFAVRYPAVGAFWCESLQLPADICQAVAHVLGPHAPATPGLAPVVRLASALAASVCQGLPEAQALAAIEPAWLAAAQLDAEAFAAGFAERYALLAQVAAAQGSS